MSMATYEDRTGTEIARFEKLRLPYHPALKDKFGVERDAWKALTEAVFPLAKSPDSVALALAYCKARNLDPFKRVVHIVPMWDPKKKGYTDTIWPSIAELRITAHRTGQYAGIDETEFGPEITKTFEGRVKTDEGWKKIEKTVTFPAWAKVTVYRHRNGITGKYVAKVRWLEAYASIGNTEVPNDMWEGRPEGQLDKCTEAAALRKAFPEELGNEYAAEEMHGRTLTLDAQTAEARIEQEAASPPKKKLRTLNDIAEHFEAEPDSDRSAPLNPADQDEPPEAPPSLASGGTFPDKDIAYKHGHDARIAGDAKNAIPKDYRGNRALTGAWKAGWEAADDEEAADGGE